MANPYYPPGANHYGGPQMRYDGQQQSSQYQNPYARQQQYQEGAYNASDPFSHAENAHPNPYGRPVGPPQGHQPQGGYYDPYGANQGADPYSSRMSLSDNTPLRAPQPGFAGRANGNTPVGFPQRPDSPADGVYPDRAPKWEKMSPAQVKIAKTFPKDLDEEPKSMLQGAKELLFRWRDFIKWKYWYYYLLLIIVVALTVLMTIFHRQIIDWLTPFSKKVKSVSWGWVIPVIIFIVISFPPLFGHEVLAILCGVVYGLWIGFAVVSLGTLLGEIANFYAFRTFLQKHAERYERKNISYGCMAHIVREGGFMVILLARLSAIPGHFTTAVFATVGMSIWTFTLAAVLSLPKQLSIVYLGVAIEQSGSGGESTTSKIVKYVVLLISLIITVWAAHYLYAKMEKARPQVQATLRAKRYTLLSEARKSEAALANTIDYDSPHTPSSEGHDSGGTRPLRGNSNAAYSRRHSQQQHQLQQHTQQQQQQQQAQPRWNRRSAQQQRPGDEEAEMQQLPYNQNTVASTSGLIPNTAPLARFDSNVSAMTMGDGLTPVTLAGSNANLNSPNLSRDDVRGSHQPQPQIHVAPPQQHRQQSGGMAGSGGPPQLRIDPNANARGVDETQLLRESPTALSPEDTLAPMGGPTKRGPRYQNVSNIGSVYSLQPSAEDGSQLGSSPPGHVDVDTASLPSYTTMAPQVEAQRQYEQQHAQQQRPQQQKGHQQSQQPQRHQSRPSQQHYQSEQYGQPQQQAYPGPNPAHANWQSPPMSMQQDLGQRRWN